MSSAQGPSRRRRGLAGIGAIAVVAALAVMAVTSLAASSPTLGVAKVTFGGRKGPIVVDSAGVAVYDLLPETTSHPLCTSTACLSAWPPVKVNGKATKASGVKGKLGTWHRDGFTQVTLNGHPLYTFSGDGGKRGVATGNGLKGFGGTWGVIQEGQAVKAGASTPAPSSSGSTSTSPGYTSIGSPTTSGSTSTSPGYTSTSTGSSGW